MRTTLSVHIRQDCADRGCMAPSLQLSMPSLAKGTLWLGCLNTIGLLFQLLFQLGAANLLGLEQFGYLTHTLSLCSFIPLIAQFGTDRILVCELIRERGRWQELVQTALAQRLLLGPLAGAVIFGTLAFAGERLQWAVALPLITLSLLSALDLVYLFDSQGQAWKHSAALGCRYLGYGLGLVAIHRLGWGSAMGAAWMMAMVSLAFLLYQLRYAKVRGWSPWMGCSWKRVGRMFRETWAVAVATACIQLYLQGPIVILGFLGDKTEVGPVVLAFQATTVLIGTLGLAYRLLLPHLTMLFVNNPEQAIAAVRQVSFWMLIVSTVCTAIAWIAAPAVLMLLKPQYASTIPLMRIALCTVPLINWSSIYGTSFLAMRRVGPFLAAALVGAVVAIGVCVLLVPICGGLGAVAGMAAAQVAVSLASAALFASHLRPMAVRKPSLVAACHVPLRDAKERV